MSDGKIISAKRRKNKSLQENHDCVNVCVLAWLSWQGP